MPRFAINTAPTPLLDSPDFRGVFGGMDGRTLKKDRVGLVREVQMVALAESSFVVYEQIDDNIVRVSTEAYPSSEYDKLYVDRRFLQFVDKIQSRPQSRMPLRNVMIERLYRAVGSRYIWGGNCREGVPQMLEYYPPGSTDADTEYWMLKGVDCSGLLYEAADGLCARNTTLLIDYGRAVEIEGLSIREIISKAQPLDYIVWPGHIVIFIEPGKIIQSRHNPFNQRNHHPDGVYIEDAAIVLEELCGNKKPVNDYPDKTIPGGFVMRRFL